MFVWFFFCFAVGKSFLLKFSEDFWQNVFREICKKFLFALFKLNFAKMLLSKSQALSFIFTEDFLLSLLEFKMKIYFPSPENFKHISLLSADRIN